MSPRDDRNEVLDRIDLPQLLDELGGPRGRNRQWPCPSPTHAQTGATPPVSVYSAAGRDLWRCHGCGAGGTAIDLVVLARGCSVADAFAELRHRAGMSDGRPPADRPQRQPRKAAPPRAPRAFTAPSPTADDATLAAFLAERGWRPEVAATFGLHAVDSPTGPRVRFPFRADGAALWWQDRAATPGQHPKYLAPKADTGYRPAPYALDLGEALEAATTRGWALLLEGPADLVALAHAFPLDGLPVLALPGGALPVARVLAMLPSVDVALLVDNDEAGERIRSAADQAAAGRRIDHVRLPDGHNDLDDLRRHLGDDDQLGALVLDLLAAAGPTIEEAGRAAA